jgi:hypothetical protein
MARRKGLSLEDAYKMATSAIPEGSRYETLVPVESLFETPGGMVDYQQLPQLPTTLGGGGGPTKKGPLRIRVDLCASHTVSSGGQMVVAKDGSTHLMGSGVQTYGPGPVYVSPELAQHLSHQDMLAREQDRRMLDPNPRYHVVGFRRGQAGETAVGVDVTNNLDFISGGMDLIHFGLTQGHRYGR